MYDPTRFDLLRSNAEDRRRALARAGQRRLVNGDGRARTRGGPVALARLLRRAARLDRPKTTGERSPAEPWTPCAEETDAERA